VRVWHGTKIPAEVRKAVNKENPLNLSGAYRDQSAGEPVEYDNLKLVLTDDTVEITLFNRGITLFTSDDERVRRIQRVPSQLEKAWEPRRHGSESAVSRPFAARC
jgi:hypothetical protein